MEVYAGIDLHSSNNYVGIIDEQDQRLYQKRLPNRLGDILPALEPFKESLKGVVVESTYNWYWLVDGLQEHGYKVHLANPSAIKQYEGLKHTDDKWDSFWLAHLKRLDILPEGYIYPKEERPVRDLLRRRLLFVRHRTSHILSLQSSITRNLGYKISGSDIKKLNESDADQIFDEPYLILSAGNSIATFKWQGGTGYFGEVGDFIPLHIKIYFNARLSGQILYRAFDLNRSQLLGAGLHVDMLQR